MSRIVVSDPTDLETEEWDPQGLNSIDKDELESFSSAEEEEEELVEETTEEEEEEEEEEVSSDLDRDGLIELEEMELSLRAEESMLDFAMVGEED
ncbi:hypothetical protein GF380_01820 [Candidatus Uhrbacteria bacterium]|nr:hypothetical protein [Candidatus Uhrbacteria bacterium]